MQTSPKAQDARQTTTSHIECKIKPTKRLQKGNLTLIESTRGGPCIKHKQPKQKLYESCIAKKVKPPQKKLGSDSMELKIEIKATSQKDSLKNVNIYNSTHKINNSCITQALNKLQKAEKEKEEAARKYEKMKTEFLRNFIHISCINKGK
jgi:hypothetical protein